MYHESQPDFQPEAAQSRPSVSVSPASNTNLAIAFLDGLDPKGRHHLTAIPFGGGITTTEAFDANERERMHSWIVARQGRLNLYYSVNEAKPDAPRDNRLNKKLVGTIRALVVDLDPEEVEGGDLSGEHFHRERERLLTVMRGAADDPTCPPTMIIDSGGGFQAIWHFDPAVPATPENVELAEGIGRTLVKRFGGDSVWNVDRIMRLPGTVNIQAPHKLAQGRKPAMATVLLEENRKGGKPFALAQLAEWAPPTPLGAKTNGSNGSGAKADPKNPVDMKVVQAADRYDELPSDLRKSLEEHCSRDHVLRALWHDGVLPTGHTDDSGSGYSFALAQRLKRAGDFTPTQFGQLLWVWDHSPDLSKINARMIWRDWDRADADAPTAEGFEAVSGPGVPFATPWGEPEDLWTATRLPAELPHGAMPEIVDRLARDGGRRLGVEPGALAAAYVTTLGSLVSAGNQMQMRQRDTGWKVKPILWTAIIGEPGSNKSATIARAIAPVEHVEAHWRAEYAAAKRKAETQSAAADEPPTSGTPATTDDIFRGVEVVPIKAVPVVVAFRQKIVHDATTEALCKTLADQPSGLLYYADELAGLVGGMDTYHAKPGKDRPFWLEAKEGKPRVVNRATGDRRTIVPNCAVSVLGGIQPTKIKSLSANLAEDGLLQRFMPILIDRRGNGVDDYPDVDAEAQLHKMALAIAQSEQNALFKFAPAADAELQAIEAFKMQELARPNTVPAMKQWLDKLPSEFGRIALVFHFIEWHASHVEQPDAAIPELVSQETAQRARRFLMKFVFSHAQAFYEQVVGQSVTDAHAQWVAGFILARKRDVIVPRDIYKNYTPLKKPDRRGDIAAVMYDLEMQDWVRPFGPGRRGEPDKWAVNPAVHERFADRAAAERARRAEVRTMIAQAGAERAAA